MESYSAISRHHISKEIYSLHIGIRKAFLTVTRSSKHDFDFAFFYIGRYLFEKDVFILLRKYFVKTNLSVRFSHFQLDILKIIHSAFAILMYDLNLSLKGNRRE
jgi:hypothetical protein